MIASPCLVDIGNGNKYVGNIFWVRISRVEFKNTLDFLSRRGYNLQTVTVDTESHYETAYVDFFQVAKDEQPAS